MISDQAVFSRLTQTAEKKKKENRSSWWKWVHRETKRWKKKRETEEVWRTALCSEWACVEQKQNPQMEKRCDTMENILLRSLFFLCEMMKRRMELWNQKEIMNGVKPRCEESRGRTDGGGTPTERQICAVAPLSKQQLEVCSRAAVKMVRSQGGNETNLLLLVELSNRSWSEKTHQLHENKRSSSLQDAAFKIHQTFVCDWKTILCIMSSCSLRSSFTATYTLFWPE